MRADSSPSPWRQVTALVLALAAQTMLEPPAHESVALILYIAAIAVVVLGNSLLSLGEGPKMKAKALSKYDTIHILPLLASLPLLGAAFYFFGDNKFTFFNLSLWLAGLALFLRAFWVKKNSDTDSTDDTENSAKNSAFVRVHPRPIIFSFLLRSETLLILSILLISSFFRFYNLSGVPAEPFSDHAEKILDVYDITQGETHIFFPRNTGREAIQFYWTILVAAIFKTGLSFQSLKIGTALLGFFTLPFIYLLGKEIAGPRAGLLAMLFAGIAYWPNVISRVGLRFPLYPLFVAPTLFFLLRGLRLHQRNDFLIAGVFLGLGLHGYSPFRIAPLLVALILVIYIIRDLRFINYILRESVLLFVTAFIVFLPLARYMLEYPTEFFYRATSRIVAPNPLPIFFSNLKNGLLMFNVDDGNIFVNSVVHRPALDVVTGALFVLGLALLLKRRSFTDLSLLSALAILILPSVLSLAFPDENPALNRAGGAIVPVFVIVGMTLDGLLTRLERGLTREGARVIAVGVTLILFAASALQNYDLVFRQYNEGYQRVVWRTSEMGVVVREFGIADRVWIVPYDQWVDTRLPALWAGWPNRDLGLPRAALADTLQLPAPKMFLFKASPLSADFNDSATLEELKRLYPQGELRLHESTPWWQSFWIYFVPAE